MYNKQQKKQNQKIYAKKSIELYFNLLEEKKYLEYEKNYIKEILKISSAFNIRLTKNEKLKFCKKCLTFFDISTREIFFDKKNCVKIFKCKKCGFERRFKYK